MNNKFNKNTNPIVEFDFLKNNSIIIIYSDAKLINVKLDPDFIKYNDSNNNKGKIIFIKEKIYFIKIFDNFIINKYRRSK